MSYNEKCYCGHAKRNHHSMKMGIMRHHSGCKYCDCIQYSPKSNGKEGWERMQKLRHEGYDDPLPSRMSDIKRIDKTKCEWSINPESYCQTICKSDYQEDYKKCAEFWLLPRKTL